MNEWLDGRDAGASSWRLRVLRYEILRCAPLGIRLRYLMAGWRQIVLCSLYSDLVFRVACAGMSR